MLLLNASEPNVRADDSEPFAATSSLAVSYTHLRAHETVLDLVCRLLLEKKNTTTHLDCTNEYITHNA